MSIGGALVAIGQAQADPTKAIVGAAQVKAAVMGNIGNQFKEMAKQMAVHKEQQLKSSFESYKTSSDELSKAGATGYKNAYLQNYANEKREEVKTLMSELQNTPAFKKNKIKELNSQISQITSDIEKEALHVSSNYQAYVDLQADIDKGGVYEYGAHELYSQLADPSVRPMSSFQLRQAMSPHIIEEDLMLDFFYDNIFKSHDDAAFIVDANGRKVRNPEIGDKVIAMTQDNESGQRAKEFLLRKTMTGEHQLYNGITDISTIFKGIGSEIEADMSTPENQATLGRMNKIKAQIQEKIGSFNAQIDEEQMDMILANPELIQITDEALSAAIAPLLTEYRNEASNLSVGLVDINQMYSLYNPTGTEDSDKDLMMALGYILQDKEDKSPMGKNNLPFLFQTLKENASKFGPNGAEKVENTIRYIKRHIESNFDKSIVEYAYNKFSNNSYNKSLSQWKTDNHRAWQRSQGDGVNLQQDLNPQTMTFGDKSFDFQMVQAPTSNSKIGVPTVNMRNAVTGEVIDSDVRRNEYIYFDGGYVIGQADEEGYMVGHKGQEVPYALGQSADGLMLSPGDDYAVNRMIRGVEKEALLKALMEQSTGQEVSDVNSTEFVDEKQQAERDIESGNIPDLANLLKEKSEYFFVNQQSFDKFGMPSKNTRAYQAHYLKLVESLNSNKQTNGGDPLNIR